MGAIFLILAILFGMGAIGDELQQNRNNYTKLFIACVIGVILIRIL